jgi:hypothetical protein
MYMIYMRKIKKKKEEFKKWSEIKIIKKIIYNKKRDMLFIKIYKNINLIIIIIIIIKLIFIKIAYKFLIKKIQICQLKN